MFIDTLIRWVSGISNQSDSRILRRLFEPLFDRQSSCVMSAAGAALVAKTAGGVLVKTGAADTYILANGVLQKVAAATDMPALVGTIVNATFNNWSFFIDSGGTVTSLLGTAGATLAAMKFPQFPSKKAYIGSIIINPTGTGNYVGGTTALNDGTVVPNVVYISAAGGMDPACVWGF